LHDLRHGVVTELQAGEAEVPVAVGVGHGKQLAVQPQLDLPAGYSRLGARVELTVLVGVEVFPATYLAVHDVAEDDQLAPVLAGQRHLDPVRGGWVPAAVHVAGGQVLPRPIGAEAQEVEADPATLVRLAAAYDHAILDQLDHDAFQPGFALLPHAVAVQVLELEDADLAIAYVQERFAHALAGLADDHLLERGALGVPFVAQGLHHVVGA